MVISAVHKLFLIPWENVGLHFPAPLKLSMTMAWPMRCNKKSYVSLPSGSFKVLWAILSPSHD